MTDNEFPDDDYEAFLYENDDMSEEEISEWLDRTIEGLTQDE